MFAGLPVLAQDSTSKVTSKINISCIQDAIDERDTLLANMVNDWASSVKSALESRRDEESSSWDISNYKERRFVQRKVWGDYGKVLGNANAIKKKERVRAWKNSSTIVKNVKALTPPR